MVLATALVGQAVLGWHNDLVDRARDASHEREDKPLVRGDLDPSTVWFWLAVAVMLVVPLAVFHGVWAGLAYLGYLLVGILGNVLLRGGWLSWVSWAASYALLPAFLAYGGFAGRGAETPPEVSVTVLARCSGSASTWSSRCPAWWPTTRTGDATCRCGSRSGPALRGCCGSRSWPPAWCWPGCWWPAPGWG